MKIFHFITILVFSSQVSFSQSDKELSAVVGVPAGAPTTIFPPLLVFLKHEVDISI
jgi:hypothetical protein